MEIKSHVRKLEKKNNRDREKYVKEVLSELGITFRTQEVRGWFARGENIIVDYPFSGKVLAGKKRVLLGAHHNKWFSSPGANDNGSGVSVLLEFVRRLKSTSPRQVFIRVVFFALEDGCIGLGAKGAKEYLKKFGFLNIDRVYNIDAVGIGDTLVIWPEKQEPWLDTLLQSASKIGMPTMFRKNSHGAGWPLFFFCNDAMPFLKKGLKKACSLHTVPSEDLKFKRLYNWMCFGSFLYDFRKSEV